MKTNLLFNLFIGLLSLTLSTATACESTASGNGNKTSIQQKGNVKTSKQSLEAFDRIEANVPLNITFTQKSEHNITLKGEAQALDRIEIRVRNGKLVIDREREECWETSRRQRVSWPSQAIECEISAQSLRDVELNSASHFNIPKKLTVSSLNYECNGSGHLEAKHIKASSLSIEQNGSGQIDIAKFEGTNASVEINGSGQADMNVECQGVDCEINGSGQIILSGHADDVRIEKNGSGSVDTSRLNK